MAEGTKIKLTEEISLEILEHIAVLKENPNGWKKEVNIIRWNDGAPKVDIRDWNPTHDRMTKGITLTEKEANSFAKAFSQRMREKQISAMKQGSYER